MKVRRVKKRHNLISDKDMFLSCLSTVLSFVDRRWQPAFRTAVSVACEKYLGVSARSIEVGPRLTDKERKKILEQMEALTKKLQA